MLVLGIAVAAAIMALAPWVRTARGNGQVVTLDRGDRQQPVTGFVPGRVERWYVQDGQHVARGDPIARVVDLDPDLLSRLATERAQVQAEIAAIRQSRAVAGIDVARTGRLLAESLAARRDYQQTQIKVADAGAKLAEARVKLNRIDIQLNRQSVQLVGAPRVVGERRNRRSIAGADIDLARFDAEMVAIGVQRRALDAYRSWVAAGLDCAPIRLSSRSPSAAAARSLAR